LDAVIGGSFFEDWPGANRLTDLLSAELARLDDYETQLDAARRWMKEWHFRVGVHHLRDVISSAEAGQHYADLAHAVLAALWDPVVAQFSAKHGPPPGAGAAVLGMGSLGAARLTSTSDLDLIVIYDGGGVEASDGRRPLPTRSYYARLTQAFVTAMTAPMAEGRLYEIDMRLRPSGKTGPVATSLAAFETYQATEAWTWEHLALTHARPVAGSADLAKRVEAVRTDLLARPREKGSVFADVTDMRMRLCEAKPQDGPWDVKNGPGGAQDIALFAETGALLAGSSLRSGAGQLAIAAAGFGLSSEHQETITSAQSLFFTVQTVGRLVAGDAFDPRDTGEGVQAFLLRETKAKDIATLQDRLASLRSNSAKIIDTILAG
jgi:glutamate-ammonia-ligase adenylyltransferase